MFACGRLCATVLHNFFPTITKTMQKYLVLLLSIYLRSSLSWVPMFNQVARFSARSATSIIARRSAFGSVSTQLRMASSEQRKAGVASPEELKSFVEKAGEKLLVVDVRNPDSIVEPGDQKSLAVAPLPSEGVRPQAVSLIWDRNTDSMPMPPTDDLETPIITHCGGGGRGQKAKDFLMSKGFKNVLNGGGPKETECWAEFGQK